MRVTISHKKNATEVKKIVDQSSDEFFKGMPVAGLQMVDPKKQWNGNTMSFNLTAKMGLFSMPLNGTVQVTDTDVTVDCDLPSFLEKLIPEDKVKAAISSKVKGLLT